METGVHVHDFAGGRAAEIRQQPQSTARHALDGGVFLQGREGPALRDHAAAVLNARQRKRADGAGRDGVAANALGAKVAGYVAGGGFERRLGHAHHIVVGDDALGAQIGEGDQRAAVRHQLFSAAGAIDEGIGGNVHRAQEVLPRGVLDEGPAQLVLVGKGDGVDQKIEGPHFLFQGGEGRIHRGVIGDFAGHEGLDPDGFAQGPDALFHGVEIGKGELRALRGQLAGYGPGDGVVIGHAHDEALLALHQVALGQVQFFGHGSGPQIR